MFVSSTIRFITSALPLSTTSPHQVLQDHHPTLILRLNQMLFRRRSRSREPIVAPPSPTRADNTQTPRTLDDIIARSAHQAKTAQHQAGSSDGSNFSFDSSSNHSQEHRKHTPLRRAPTSRKTGHATIRTDSTDTHAAFESDAFAVLMPTTRLLILDRPVSPVKAASTQARAEALQTYQEKARQVRERNNSLGVKFPSKIVSYDYASWHVAVRRTAPEMEAKSPTPAGSYPISPPLPQHAWARPERTIKTIEVHEIRHVHGLSSITPPRKPASTQSSKRVPTSPASCYQVYRADSTAGASHSPASSSPLSAPIKARVKTKPVVVKEQDRVQTESRYSLYNKPPSDTPSPRCSRSSSLVKSMPNFKASNEVEGDSIFGYRSRSIERTVAGASSNSTAAMDREKALEKARHKLAERAKKTSPKRTLTTRWPWLRPSGPRIAKPTTTPVVFSLPAEKPTTPSPHPIVTATNRTYIDPFASPTSPHPLPTPPSLLASRPTSPKELATHPPATKVPATPTFDSGFAQIKSLTYIIFKIGLLLYAFIALWFVLDAVREAIHMIGVPFRIVASFGAVVLDGLSWVWERVWAWMLVVWRRWR